LTEGSAENWRDPLLAIWRRLLDAPNLAIDDDFFDKGGDSLLAAEFMLELRRLTGRSIPDSLLFESSTVRSLAEKLSAPESLEPKLAFEAAAAFDYATPLLFFHGDWSAGGFYVRHLARKLGGGVSVIAVAPHGVEGAPLPPSFEAMAADRLPEILHAQPHGPYLLAGHCVGGIVALETARLLAAADRRVDAVVMIDPPLSVGGHLLRNPPEAVEPPISYAHGDEIPSVRKYFEDVGDTMARYAECLDRYTPRPLAVRLSVLASEFDGRPWLRVSADAALISKGVGHYDWVTHGIGELAGHLTGEIAQRARV